ncbi:MAG TPA: response regulator transcription factor [Anaerolineae bacterium]|jgi:two-component system response regulator NreC
MDAVKPLRVVLTDDHAIMRHGLRALLAAQADIEVIGEAADGIEALQLVRQLHPDVVVMDITMPNLNGLDATRAITQEFSDVRVLILTMHENDEYFFKALHAGASGYVLKQVAANDLINAIRAVAHGEVFLYPSLASKLLTDYVRQDPLLQRQGQHEQITAREQEVLNMIAQGLSNREIAEQMVLSLSTVQTHYYHLLQKLGLHNRVGLAKYAIRHGMFDSDN